MRNSLAVVALSAMALAAALPAGANTRVYVKVAPPVAIVETHATAPSTRHVWIAGYHRWDGAAYAWVPGRWAIPPAHHHTWVPGHWAHEKHGYYWIDGHWR
jgi:WXXGXW repeat (2 copies)